MNTQDMTSSTTAAPFCFGDPKAWDRNAPECAGGPDANYAEGRGVRKQCSFFQSCGVRVAMKTNGIAGSYIPASSLIRPPVVTPPPSTPQPSYRPFDNAPVAPQPTGFAEYLRNFDAQRKQAIGQPVATSQQYAGPWIGNYAVPSFLTEQEVRYPGESWWAPFFRMALRGVGKALGMVASHWFDTHIVKRQPQEEKKDGP
jgi:hypothetical protein